MDALALVFSLLVGAFSFVVAIWALVTHRFSLDGLLLVLLSLLFAAVFGGNFAWAVYRGEARAIFKAFLDRRKGSQ